MNTKQLRQKILDLAIRGKLVPQDPNDEPASVLLERVRHEKERLIKEGKIKRDKKESNIFRNTDKSHYEQLPDGWAWCRLGELGEIVGGGTPHTNELSYWDGSISWITPADLSGYSEKYISVGKRKITEKGLVESSTKLMPAGSILFSSRAPIGYCVIAENAVCTNQGFKSIIPFILDTNEYIYYYLIATVEEIRLRASGTTFKEISGTEMGNTILTLPPLAEQHRIVAAIESAFAVIDEIERNQADLQAAITAAKSKILDLAIRGKLVPQDPNDEPASVLLERIRAEREQLIKAGKIKRNKSDFTAVKSDDNSYYQNVPIGWVLVRLDEVLNYEQPTDYIVKSINYSDDYEIPVLTAGKSFIVGFTNEMTGICDKLPVIIFDDFTTDSRYVDFRFKVKSSAMKILTGVGIEMKYLFYYMQTIKVNHTTHKRYWISDYSKNKILLPPVQEQARIVEIIDKSFEFLEKINGNLN